MTTSPVGAIRPTPQDLSRALLNIQSCASLMESIQLGFTKPPDVPHHLDVIQQSLRDALRDLGAPAVRIPTPNEIAGAAVDEADDYFAPFDEVAVNPPVTWTLAKALIVRGIEAGIKLAGGAS